MPTLRAAHRDYRLLAGPLAGLSFMAGIAAAMTTARSPYPRPGTQPDAVRDYFVGSARSARVSVAGQLLACVALGVFTAAVADWLARAGRQPGRLRAAASIGGAFAATTLATSALASAELTRDASDLERVRALHRFVFLAGGPVHNVGLGVLTGALGLAGLRTRAVPAALSRACLAWAALCVLSPLSLMAQPTLVVIPLARFPALLLDGMAGAWLLLRQP